MDFYVDLPKAGSCTFFAKEEFKQEVVKLIESGEKEVSE